jgi:hypothetical protein
MRPADRELEGMTVNERLWACDLYDRFMKGARKRDREEMVSVLTEVAFTHEQASGIVDKILADPERFGF